METALEPLADLLTGVIVCSWPERAASHGVPSIIPTGRHSGKEWSMKVKEAMHQGVQWVEPGTSVFELARLMREYDIGAIPIGEKDRLIGMVTDRDIVCRCIAIGADPTASTARDVMTKGIVFCLDKQELDDAARVMETKRVRRLPVINSKKRMVGMLSLGDVYDKAQPTVSRQAMHGVSSHHKNERRG
jgi:CBS domain-containing protein